MEDNSAEGLASDQMGLDWFITLDITGAAQDNTSADLTGEDGTGLDWFIGMDGRGIDRRWQTSALN